MEAQLKKALTEIAEKRIDNDISHDFNHSLRVLSLAETIAKKEKADLDVVVPAALFHDVVVYKGRRKAKGDSEKSALVANKILSGIPAYPRRKIDQVCYAIRVCSFSKNIEPDTLEAKVLQDADMLEAVGAIAVARTFASASVMHNLALFDSFDPFCRNRVPDDRTYSLDLFYTRLLQVEARLHTVSARKLAGRRIKFLHSFLRELELELKESGAGLFDDVLVRKAV